MTVRHLIWILAMFLPTLAVSGDEFSLPQLEINYTGSVNYNNYIPGSMKLTDTDGSVTEHDAQFKTRGATALKYTMKPSLNMKLITPEGEELDDNLLGIRKASSFILDAMAIDRICMRNRVCFDIWNEMSRLPYETDFESRNGTVGRFVEVTINGTYKGIYCLSDKINRKLLDLKKPQVDEETGEVTIRGVMYKNGTNDLANQNTVGMFNDGMVYVVEWHNAWELHHPEEYATEETWAPLLEAMRNGSSYSYVADHFHMQNLADVTIHVMALCISDNWGNKNRYFSIRNLQKDGDDAKFVITPWDLDTSLGGEYDGSRYNGNYKQWSMADIAKNCPKPIGACMGRADFKDLLKQTWRSARKGALSVESVKQKMQDYCDLFVKSGAWDRYVTYWNSRGSRPMYVADLQKEIDLIGDWYADRFVQMDKYFGINPDETGIDYIIDDTTPAPVIYNLQGQPVKETLPGNIYIINGRKVTIPNL